MTFNDLESQFTAVLYCDQTAEARITLFWLLSTDEPVLGIPMGPRVQCESHE